MHTPDFAEFREILNGLARMFSPLKPLPDDLLVQRYWVALRNLSIETIKRCAERHERYGRFFPKPIELRPKEDRKSEETPAQQVQFETAIAENRRNWDKRFADDPQLARIELGLAKAARIEVLSHESTPQHAEAYRETVDLMRQRDELLHERATANPRRPTSTHQEATC